MTTKCDFVLRAHSPFRRAVAEVLDGDPDFQVVAQGGLLAEFEAAELGHHDIHVTIVEPPLSDGDGPPG